MFDKELVEQIAAEAFKKYGDSTGGLNYQGKPIPPLEECGEVVQRAWIAATAHVLLRATMICEDLAQDNLIEVRLKTDTEMDSACDFLEEVLEEFGKPLPKGE